MLNIEILQGSMQHSGGEVVGFILFTFVVRF